MRFSPHKFAVVYWFTNLYRHGFFTGWHTFLNVVHFEKSLYDFTANFAENVLSLFAFGPFEIVILKCEGYKL